MVSDREMGLIQGRRKKSVPEPDRFFDLSPCVDYTRGH